MAERFEVIAFDADDTLWHNERFFQLTQERFTELLADYSDEGHLAARLLAAERRNLGHYGYGIKGFVLSMIETAIEVTDARVPARVISDILAAGQEMLAHPIELLPHAAEVVAEMAAAHRVLLITKGDLLDQERKLAQSGLRGHFDGVEIVAEKNIVTYDRIFIAHDAAPERSLMAGNSMKSDVLPVIDLGGVGVYVPHGKTWELEKADAPKDSDRYHKLTDLGALPELVAQLEADM